VTFSNQRPIDKTWDCLSAPLWPHTTSRLSAYVHLGTDPFPQRRTQLFTIMPGGIQPPFEVILTWPIPNYVNPPTRSPYVLIVACILGPISTILLFARLWVRIRMQRNAGLDDWLMLASLVSVVMILKPNDI
jgi:hypothetical protein